MEYGFGYIIYWCNIGIMEKKMEATILYLGYTGNIRSPYAPYSIYLRGGCKLCCVRKLSATDSRECEVTERSVDLDMSCSLNS